MTQAADGLERRVLQRVVIPADDNLDVVPLYIETEMARGDAAAADLLQGRDESGTHRNAFVGDKQSTAVFGGNAGGARGWLPRQSITVRAQSRVSFATYFNAFPASYWRRWTHVESVTLRLRIVGDATVVVYRSTARGQSHPVDSIPVRCDEPVDVERALPLTQFIDGGWYWFDIAAGPRGVTLIEADWAADVPAARHGRVSIGITTFNRADFVVELLRAIGSATDVVDVLDTVYLVDQGGAKASAHPDFADATKALGEHLSVIEQANLGGSGGFSRAMYETSRAGVSDYVILLDDDVVLEPESVLRAATFADLARTPTIVGGHMFSLHDRAVLNAFGETIAPYKWWWGAAPHTRPDHDFGRLGLRHTPWLHRRVDADYNGWWMCLIPTSLVGELGLSLPVFIKWDDAEYGLRAQAKGYPTVSLPGVAVWHVPWNDKNDALDWQAYYHIRNRLLAALLHSPYERGGRAVIESMENQIQHLLSMQYSTAALRLLALEDLLSGPDHLHRDLPTKLAQLRALRSEYSDARGLADVESFPPVRRRKPPSRGRQSTSPTNKVGLVLKVAFGAARQLTPVKPGAQTRPTAALPHLDAAWWALAGIDSVLVSAADGTTAAWYKRDRALFRSQLARSAAAHAQLMRQWPELAAAYRAAATEITSFEAWAATFEPGTPEPVTPEPVTPE